jgi:endonuclease/exonuclease/phosphatase family metal-dependent hydrolase
MEKRCVWTLCIFNTLILSVMSFLVGTKTLTKTSLEGVKMEETFSVVQWNIDGLSEAYITSRTCQAADQMLKADPDVVMVQEVVPETLILLKSMLAPTYVPVGSGGAHLRGYFTSTFVHCRNSIIRHSREDFTGLAVSAMGRDTLTCVVDIMGREVTFINTHLESMKDNGAVRVEQLKSICTRMLDTTTGPAITAGDLNMRDAEQKTAFDSTGGSRGVLKDAYVEFGKPKDCYGTWIMPNKEEVKCRFDRCYHNGRGIKLVPCSSTRPMELLGETRLLPCGNQRPSDHLGVHTRFMFAQGPLRPRRTAAATASSTASVPASTSASTSVSRTTAVPSSSPLSHVDLTCDRDNQQQGICENSSKVNVNGNGNGNDDDDSNGDWPESDLQQAMAMSQMGYAGSTAACGGGNDLSIAETQEDPDLPPSTYARPSPAKRTRGEDVHPHVCVGVDGEARARVGDEETPKEQKRRLMMGAVQRRLGLQPSPSAPPSQLLAIVADAKTNILSSSPSPDPTTATVASEVLDLTGD